MATDNEYFFRFSTPTRLSGNDWKAHQKGLPAILSLNVAGGGNFCLFDRRLKCGRNYAHSGLGLDVQVSAATKREAFTRAHDIAMSLTPLIAFVTSFYVPPPYLILSYRICGNVCEEYEAVALPGDPFFTNAEMRHIQTERLRLVISRLERMPHDLRHGLAQALFSYWKALGSLDRRDCFINLWIALEYIEASLKGLYKLPTGQVVKRAACPQCKQTLEAPCPICGSPITYKGSIGMEGLKTIRKTHSGLAQTLSVHDLHSNRSKLIHTTAAMPAQELEESIASARALLFASAFTLLGIQCDLAAEMKRPMIGESWPFLIGFAGTVNLKQSLSLNDRDLQPEVHGKYKIRFKWDAEHDTAITLPEVAHTFQGAFASGEVRKNIMVDRGVVVKDIWERNE